MGKATAKAVTRWIKVLRMGTAGRDESTDIPDRSECERLSA